MAPTLRSLAPLLLVVGCAPDYEVVPKPVDVNPGDVTECGFTRVEGTAFYAYDCNPVFDTTGEDWAPSVGSVAFNVTYVMDHPFYQLWYVAYDETQEHYGLGYAISSNGTDWEPHDANPLLTEEGADDFERDVMQANQVVWDPLQDKYVMIYSGLDLSGGSDGGTGVVTSPDGVSWTRIDANPVLNANRTGVDGVEGWCWPLDINLGSVAGYTGYMAGSGRRGACEGYRFDASRPDLWDIDPVVAFPAGDEGEWDDEGLISLNEAILGDTHYLFYVGFGAWTNQGSVRVATNAYLGMATSSHGRTWTKDPTPIPVNTTEDGQVSAVGAVTVGSRIHLWVTDQYDDHSAVGYFLYDPEAAAAEDGG